MPSDVWATWPSIGQMLISRKWWRSMITSMSTAEFEICRTIERWRICHWSVSFFVSRCFRRWLKATNHLSLIWKRSVLMICVSWRRTFRMKGACLISFLLSTIGLSRAWIRSSPEWRNVETPMDLRIRARTIRFMPSRNSCRWRTGCGTKRMSLIITHLQVSI